MSTPTNKSTCRATPPLPRSPFSSRGRTAAQSAWFRHQPRGQCHQGHMAGADHRGELQKDGAHRSHVTPLDGQGVHSRGAKLLWRAHHHRGAARTHRPKTQCIRRRRETHLITQPLDEYTATVEENAERKDTAGANVAYKFAEVDKRMQLPEDMEQKLKCTIEPRLAGRQKRRPGK